MSFASCDEVREVSDLYVAGELLADELAPFEAHLAGCEACREAVELDRATRNSLRKLTRRLRPSPMLEARIRTALDNVPRMRRVYLAAAALLLGLGLGLAAWVVQAARPWSSTQDMVHKHAVYRDQVQPGWEISTPDREELARWASARVGYPVRLPALTDSWTVHGIRTERVNGVPAMMAFLTDDHNTQASLFAIRADQVDADVFGGGVEELEPHDDRRLVRVRLEKLHGRRQFMLVTWREGPLLYGVVRTLPDPADVR